MADIVLKDRNGNGINYPGITSIKVNTVSGETAEFVDSATIPESVENIPIALDFSDGDQTITAPDGMVVKSAIIQKPENLLPENVAEGVDIAGITGTLTVPASEEKTVIPDFSGGDMEVTPGEGAMFSKVTVQKPENLLPENIAEGVDIAGIIGTLAGGGKAIVKSGFSSTGETTRTITHGLGVVPDLIFMFPIASFTSTGYLDLAFGVSDAGRKALNWGATTGNLSMWSLASSTARETAISYITDEPSAYSGAIYNANESTFTVGYTGKYLYANKSYFWLAIGGLT